MTEQNVTPKLKVLSLGWGVQSFTLAAMSALGELPKLDLLIHADTSWEREATYRFAEKYTPWLEVHGLTVVSACSLSARNPERDGSKIHIPAFYRNNQGVIGMINRQCTDKWKITVVKQLIRQELERLGLKPKPGIVEQWLGISWDEATRAKNSDTKYITIRHPFLEKATRMTRAKCIEWLKAHKLDIPVKSSCTHCVFHSQPQWQLMKRMGGHDWNQALNFDESIRGKSTKYDGLFVHRSALPLSVAVNRDYIQTTLMEAEGAGCDSAGYCWD